jgi:hypothetical protein
VVWSERKDLLSWLTCHNRSFERLSGIAAVNRIDNVKTALSEGAGPWGTIHPAYRAYARAVGFHVDACNPRDPEAKGVNALPNLPLSSQLKIPPPGFLCRSAWSDEVGLE